jgi:hypothetical protein
LTSRFLRELEKAETPYPVAVAAFWLIELVYNASFMSCLEEGSKTPFELLSTVKRWGSPEFYQYVISLKHLADKALENASEVEQKKAHEVKIRAGLRNYHVLKEGIFMTIIFHMLAFEDGILLQVVL